MILIVALCAGAAVGIARAFWNGEAYQIPSFSRYGSLYAALVLQFAVLYTPIGRGLPVPAIGIFVAVSQFLLTLFAFANRAMHGMSVIVLGLALNLVVMAANGGLMPIDSQTASALVSRERLESLEDGGRFGTKDVLLDNARLSFLGDRFVISYPWRSREAFSLGDAFIALGAFWSLARVVKQRS
jgi:hypothetical protein